MSGDMEFFPFGASYCPYAKSEDLPMSEWEGDIKKMKELGFTVFRSFVSWDRIELKEGCLDFSKLDHVSELAEKYGLKMMFNLGGVFDGYGGIYTPRWLIKNYNCQHKVDDPYLKKASYGPLRRICLDDPVYEQKAFEFIEKVVERYSQYSHLMAWVVWNEPFLRFPCYCPLSVKKFQDWLKEKYNGNLDEINRRWGTEFPVDYEKWEEIEPPSGAGFSAGGYVPMLDWLRFNEENLASKVKAVHDSVKKCDPEKRETTTNLVFHSANRESATHRCCDIWKIGRSLDVVGYSHYTIKREEPFEIAARLSRISSASMEKNKKFWVIETEGGPVGGDYNFNAEGKRRKFLNYHAVSHGAKSLLLWKYRGRVSDNQTDQFNLMAWDGSVTERASGNSEVCADLQKIAPMLVGKKCKADVAILHSSDQALAHEIKGSADLWRNSWQGAFRFFWEKDIPTDFINDEQIKSGKLKDYKILVMPFCENIPEEVCKGIKEYVVSGGRIVADYYVGCKNEDGKQNLRAPAFGLEKVFGAYYNDMLRPEHGELIKLKEQEDDFITAHEYKHILYPSESSEVIAEFKDGKAAAVKNKCGKGEAVLVGTMFFASCKEEVSKGANGLLSFFLEDAGVAPPYKILSCKPEGSEKNIEVRKLEEDGENPILFVMNHNDERAEIELEIEPEKIKNILNGKALTSKNLKIDGKEIFVLEIN